MSRELPDDREVLEHERLDNEARQRKCRRVLAKYDRGHYLNREYDGQLAWLTCERDRIEREISELGSPPAATPNRAPGRPPHGWIRMDLQQRRKEVGLSQERLAELLRVTAKTVSRWEKARSIPSDRADEIDRISQPDTK